MNIESKRKAYITKLRKQGVPENKIKARLRGWDSVDTYRRAAK